MDLGYGYVSHLAAIRFGSNDLVVPLQRVDRPWLYRLCAQLDSSRAV